RRRRSRPGCCARTPAGCTGSVEVAHRERPSVCWESPMARVLKPPAPLVLDGTAPSVFLAGSIEMGRAEDWQARLTRALGDLDVWILNPRRDEWDASWEQSIHNAKFREQVEWELTGLERATVVAMYFAPSTQAPVT